MLKQLKISLLMCLLMMVLTGVIYPLAITGLAQLVFPARANGSLVKNEQGVVGSALIGQQFDDPRYFWGRLSATSGGAYNAAASSGSNLGPDNPALIKQAKDRIVELRAADPQNLQPVPVDLVTASASGLDPDISLAAARYQAGRVARARGLSVDQVEAVIDQNTESPLFGFLGESYVNVLKLNMAVDALK